MQLTKLLVILSICLAPSISQKLTPNSVKSLLQGILFPRNKEQQLMQILSTASNKNGAMPNMPGMVKRRFVMTDEPGTVIRTDTPKRQFVQRPPEKSMNRNVVLIPNSNNVIVQNGNQIVLPKNMVVQRKPETVLPNKYIIQNGGEVKLPRNVIVRNNEMPKRMVVQNNDFAMEVSQMSKPEVVQQKVSITQPNMTKYVKIPEQKGFTYNENPFLPAASPISPFTALSSDCIPSAMPKCRGQYLRKIPIPPPCM